MTREGSLAPYFSPLVYPSPEVPGGRERRNGLILLFAALSRNHLRNLCSGSLTSSQHIENMYLAENGGCVSGPIEFMKPLVWSFLLIQYIDTRHMLRAVGAMSWVG